MMKRFLAVTASVAPTVVFGQVSYSGGAYVETFDSLPTASAFQNLDGQWQNNGTLPGWYRLMTSDGTAVGVEERWRVDDGGASGGSLYSYGRFGSSDRALGFATSSNIPVAHIGVRLLNVTGGLLSRFDLQYVGEQWRHGAAGAQSLTFSYRLGGGPIETGTWTAVSALDFSAPRILGSGTALDGNVPGNQALIAGSVSGFDWNPGEELWLRWTGTDRPGSDHGLAVDDVRITAVPEPATMLALVAGLTAFGARRRPR